MTDFTERLGPALRRRRLACGLKQREVAARAGVQPANLSAWEHGRRLPPLHALVKVLGILDARLEIRLNNDERETR